MDFVILVFGIAVLYLGGESLVRGAVGVAAIFRLSPLIVGLTLVSFATSAPELLISITASLKNLGGIAVGNVVGSNIANIMLILGVSLLFGSVECISHTVRRNYLFMLAATFVFIIMTLDGYFDFVDGLILLILLCYFLFRLWQIAYYKLDPESNNKSDDCNDFMADNHLPVVVNNWSSRLKLFTMIAGGIVLLAIGANYTVESASAIARDLGVSDSIIAVTVVAFGTSLPELAASIVSIVRKHSAIAIGNVIGSNIFNILAIIGISAVIVPISVPADIGIDMIIMALCSLILVPYIMPPKWQANWRIGTIMIGGYVIYILFNLLRGGQLPLSI